jgi:hypothetical protein
MAGWLSLRNHQSKRKTVMTRSPNRAWKSAVVSRQSYVLKLHLAAAQNPVELVQQRLESIVFTSTLSQLE